MSRAMACGRIDADFQARTTTCTLVLCVLSLASSKALTASCNGNCPVSSGRTSTRRVAQVRDRPVELDAPAERAAEVELLRHQLVDDERQRLVRQRADLHDARALSPRRRRYSSAAKLPETSSATSNCGARARPPRGRARIVRRRRPRAPSRAAGRATSLTVTSAAPARRAAITVRQPIVPAPVTSTDLPSRSPARCTACSADGERLGERELAQRDVAGDRDSTGARPSRSIRWNMPCTCGKRLALPRKLHVAAQLLAALRGSSRSGRTRATG